MHVADSKRKTAKRGHTRCHEVYTPYERDDTALPVAEFVDEPTTCLWCLRRRW